MYRERGPNQEPRCKNNSRGGQSRGPGVLRGARERLTGGPDGGLMGLTRLVSRLLPGARPCRRDRESTALRACALSRRNAYPFHVLHCPLGDVDVHRPSKLASFPESKPIGSPLRGGPLSRVRRLAKEKSRDWGWGEARPANGCFVLPPRPPRSTVFFILFFSQDPQEATRLGGQRCVLLLVGGGQGRPAWLPGGGGVREGKKIRTSGRRGRRARRLLPQGSG